MSQECERIGRRLKWEWSRCASIARVRDTRSANKKTDFRRESRVCVCVCVCARARVDRRCMSHVARKLGTIRSGCINAYRYRRVHVRIFGSFAHYACLLRKKRDSLAGYFQNKSQSVEFVRGTKKSTHGVTNESVEMLWVKI